MGVGVGSVGVGVGSVGVGVGSGVHDGRSPSKGYAWISWPPDWPCEVWVSEPAV